MKNYLTTKQASRLLRVSSQKVCEYIRQGKLKAHRLGGNGKSRRHWRISETDLENFILGRHNAGFVKDKGSQNNNSDSSSLSTKPAVHNKGACELAVKSGINNNIVSNSPESTSSLINKGKIK